MKRLQRFTSKKIIIFPLVILLLLLIVSHFMDIPVTTCIEGKLRNIDTYSLPPTYSNVEWKQTKTENLSFYSWSGEMTEAYGEHIEGVGLWQHPSEFTNYYDHELGLRCWIKVDTFNHPQGLSVAYATLSGKYFWVGSYSTNISEHPNEYTVYIDHN